MNIRLLLPLAFSFAFCATARSENTPVRFFYKDGSQKYALILEYKNGKFLHQPSETNLSKETSQDGQVKSIYFYEPQVFKDAMSLYRGRKYKEASVMFAKCEKDFKAVEKLKGNYSTLAGFYKIECARRMLNLDDLVRAQEKFDGAALVKQSHLTQLELNSLWATVRIEDWKKIAPLVDQWLSKDLSSSQLAQVLYCQALTLEELAKGDAAKISEAIDAYSRVMVVDHTLSAELVAKSAENMLNIYAKDGDVKKAMSLSGSEDEKKGAEGYDKLVTAGALAKTYRLAGLEEIKKLTLAHEAFIKFAPEKKVVEKSEKVVEKAPEKVLEKATVKKTDVKKPTPKKKTTKKKAPKKKGKKQK